MLFAMSETLTHIPKCDDISDACFGVVLHALKGRFIYLTLHPSQSPQVSTFFFFESALENVAHQFSSSLFSNRKPSLPYARIYSTGYNKRFARAYERDSDT